MTKERIEDMREVIIPFVKKRLLEINYEGKGESDAEEFERDFHKILDLAESALDQHWIRVEDQLPEPFTFVNATCRSLVDDRENWVIETLYLHIPEEANKYHLSDWGNIPMLNHGKAEVIAWVERFIPEPYKAEEQDNAKNNSWYIRR